MKHNIQNNKLQQVVEVLEKQFGDLNNNSGCNINRQWFSPKAILDVIKEIDKKID